MALAGRMEDVGKGSAAKNAYCSAVKECKEEIRTRNEGNRECRYR